VVFDVEKFMLEEMTAQEVSETLRSVDTVLVPVGTLEQHGPHLPIGTDVFIPVEVARRVAEKMNVVVAPPVYYGNSSSMKHMKGVFSVTPESLASFLYDICRSLASQGFKKIVLLNGHSGNMQVIDFIGHKLREETGAKIVRIEWWTIAYEEIPKICGSPVSHADQGETSMLMACRPGLAQMDKAVKDETFTEKVQKLTDGKPKNMQKVYVPFDTWTKTGLIGDATKASVEKGQKMLEVVVENIVKFLKGLDEVVP